MWETFWKPIILFAIGFVLLIKGGDWFVDGAVGIAKRFHIPEIIIGATVVSIGTTLPEVMVSAGAALSGKSATAYGNAIGSIICNTALIAALSIAIRPSDADRKPLVLPVIFFFVSAIFYTATAYLGGNFTRVVGIILLTVFVIYIVTSVILAKKSPVLPEPEPDEREPEKQSALWKEILFLILGAGFIALGARLLIDNCSIIAIEILHVPESVVALTIVALGTSLPELITAITSLIKGHNSLSLGNIIGANLFNLVLVSGLSITLAPFALPTEKMIFGMNASLVVDVPVMFSVMVLLTVPTIVKKKTSRWQGITLLTVMALYYVFQFAL